MASAATTVILAASLVALGLFVLTLSVAATSDSVRARAVTNLQRDLGGPTRREVAAPSPALIRAARLITPTAWISKVDRLLAAAGRPPAWPIERVLVTKLLLGCLGLALGGWLYITAESERTLLLVVLIPILGWFLPEILLYNSATKRRKSIRLKLPDVLDQLTIAVEAGLGFEAAMAHVGRNTGGPLGDELIRTLQDIQVGTPRRTAYRALAERAGVDDLTRFVRAIIQAEQYGVSIAAVLGAQAREMRTKRRQRAEEAAMKIPVKVVFPLILFIMPTLFIIVLGPAVLNIVEFFQGGQFPSAP